MTAGGRKLQVAKLIHKSLSLQSMSRRHRDLHE